MNQKPKAIVGRVDLELTGKQTEKLRAVWNKFGRSGGTMFAMNLMTKAGPFHLKKAVIKVAVFDPELASEVGIVIEAHRKARP